MKIVWTTFNNDVEVSSARADDVREKDEQRGEKLPLAVHDRYRYRLPMKIQRNNKLIAYGWIERERLRVLVVTKNPRRRTTRKTEIISSVFGRWLLTQKSPEPVHVRLRLRKHDVKRRGASPQRLLDILRADDERTREFGTAAWKRVLPIKLYSVDYCTSPLNSMPIWFRCV